MDRILNSPSLKSIHDDPFHLLSLVNPLPDDKILDRLKQIAKDILKCIKNEK